MLENVTLADFDEVFKIMESSFPPDEYRDYSSQKALFYEKRYKLFCKKNSGCVVAFIAVWEFDEFVFVEHFAVDKSLRGKGTGTQMLAEIKEKFNKQLCLEVEPPVDEITKRRVGFYSRNGFFLNEYDYVQPAMLDGKNPIPLMVMSSGSILDKNRFELVKSILYKEVYNVIC